MGERETLISVIMPAFNAAAFIGESIASVRAQLRPDWELLVINDGSTDDTVQIVNSFIAVDDRIQLLHQPNGKQGKARNLGIKAASGRLIAFLDADDLWLPNHLEVLVHQLVALNADLVFSGARLFPQQINSSQKQLAGFDILLQGKVGIHTLLNKNVIPILTVLVRKEVIAAANGFSEGSDFQNVEDYDLWLRILHKGFKMKGISELTAAYRLHPHSSWSSKDEQANLEKHFWFFGQLWQSGNYKEHALVFQSHFRMLGNRLLELYAAGRQHHSFFSHWQKLLKLDTGLAIRWLPFLIRFQLARYKPRFT